MTFRPPAVNGTAVTVTSVRATPDGVVIFPDTVASFCATKSMPERFSPAARTTGVAASRVAAFCHHCGASGTESSLVEYTRTV